MHYYVVFKKHNLGLSKVVGIVTDDAPSAIGIKMAQSLFFFTNKHTWYNFKINQYSIIALFMNKT
jgi:hypothetical protein